MWLKCLFLALLTQCLALQHQDCTQVDRKTKNLTIQLQVSQSSEFDFSGYISAVELALQFINTNSCVLPDYHISFTDIVDPQVSSQQFHTITEFSTVLFIQLYTRITVHLLYLYTTYILYMCLVTVCYLVSRIVLLSATATIIQ